MSDEITPALTRGEWADAMRQWDGGSTKGETILQYAAAEAQGLTMGSLRHGLAALALYGQPFGFTREDVDTLRAAASAIRNEWGEWDDGAIMLELLADRIAALLPPEPVNDHG